MSNELPMMDTPTPPVPATQANSLRSRYVVRRGNSTNYEPLIGNATKGEVEARLEREIVGGQVQEIDLYEYVGTVKLKRSSEMVNVFEAQE